MDRSRCLSFIGRSPRSPSVVGPGVLAQQAATSEEDDPVFHEAEEGVGQSGVLRGGRAQAVGGEDARDGGEGAEQRAGSAPAFAGDKERGAHEGARERPAEEGA